MSQAHDRISGAGDAIATLDNEDEDIFRIVGGALRRLHPEQAELVLDGIGRGEGRSDMGGAGGARGAVDG